MGNITGPGTYCQRNGDIVDVLKIEYSKIMPARDGTCNPIDADAIIAALRGAA